MHLIRGIHNIKPSHQGCALTIGNFDGLHLGHQALLRLLDEVAEKKQLKRCMMSFDPLPHEFFAGGLERPRLMNTRDKLIALASYSPVFCPDYVLLMKFNSELSSMTAAEFIEKILVEKLAIKALVIGDDFQFGHDRKGNLELLLEYGAKYDFEVDALDTHHHDDSRVSSTRVREALMNGDLEGCKSMLGRDYQICGRVAHGEKRGRTIGFPTANIHLHRPSTPLQGVYSVTMLSSTLGAVKGIANVGYRPTVEGDHVRIEVHLFDFDQDIYGENVCIAFHHRIRDEQKFESFDALKNQIQLDCQQAREWHGLTNN
jgi:riboflavin kinase/FMN adenylyltransferase